MSTTLTANTFGIEEVLKQLGLKENNYGASTGLKHTITKGKKIGRAPAGCAPINCLNLKHGFFWRGFVAFNTRQNFSTGPLNANPAFNFHPFSRLQIFVMFKEVGNL